MTTTLSPPPILQDLHRISSLHPRHTTVHECDTSRASIWLCDLSTCPSVRETDPPPHPDPLILHAPPCFKRCASRSRFEIHPPIAADTRPSNGIQHSTRSQPTFNPTHPARPTASKTRLAHVHGPGLQAPSCRLDGFPLLLRFSLTTAGLRAVEFYFGKLLPHVLH